MRRILVISAVVIGVWAVSKTTKLGSYAGTLWSQARSEAKRQVPTRFEIQRARHEIAQLDRDISAAIRPIAEYKAAVQQLDADLVKVRGKLTDRREALLRLARDLESATSFVSIGGKDVPVARAKAALDRDFEGFQRLEKHGDSLTKLHESKQQSLEAAQEQLAKLTSKKREYEIRLAQLEADEETLRIASLGNKIAVDDNRASAIEAALAEIEQRHNVRRAELELSAGDLIPDTLAPPRATADLAAIKAHLEKSRGE